MLISRLFPPAPTLQKPLHPSQPRQGLRVSEDLGPKKTLRLHPPGLKYAMRNPASESQCTSSQAAPEGCSQGAGLYRVYIEYSLPIPISSFSTLFLCDLGFGMHRLRCLPCGLHQKRKIRRSMPQMSKLPIMVCQFR